MVKEYRRRKGITQRELAEELKPICPQMDAYLISKIEAGIVEPSSLVKEYLNKALASQPNEGKTNDGVIVPSESKIALKGDLENKAYEILKAVPDGIQKSELSLMLKTDDRITRMTIEHLRSEGIRVVWDTKGYHIAKDDAEYFKFEKHYLSQAFRLLTIAKAMRGNNDGQFMWGGL